MGWGRGLGIGLGVSADVKVDFILTRKSLAFSLFTKLESKDSRPLSLETLLMLNSFVKLGRKGIKQCQLSTYLLELLGSFFLAISGKHWGV